MAQYLLSVYQPDGAAPPPEVLAPIIAALDDFNADLRTAGAWVFAAGLHAALSWADRMARIITLPIEVRPFQG